MIGKFWEVLFDYADKAKAEGDRRKYEICHEIEDLLQQAYDDGMEFSSVIKGHKPKDKVEEMVLSIPDIKVYKDKNDGQIWYELESEYNDYEIRRFDYPEEVIKQVIAYRTKRLESAMGKERDMLLTYISKRLTEIKMVREVLEKDGKKKVVIVEGKK